jgi:hypothetical protein
MQVQLTSEQAKSLKEVATTRGLSVAALVRESVDRYLEQSRYLEPTHEELMQRVLALAGKGASGHSDISERHDDYLAEAYAE